jgi:hypothetical protein
MNTVPITTEGWVFVAQMIRDVRARERIGAGLLSLQRLAARSFWAAIGALMSRLMTLLVVAAALAAPAKADAELRQSALLLVYYWRCQIFDVPPKVNALTEATAKEYGMRAMRAEIEEVDKLRAKSGNATWCPEMKQIVVEPALRRLDKILK